MVTFSFIVLLGYICICYAKTINGIPRDMISTVVDEYIVHLEKKEFENVNKAVEQPRKTKSPPPGKLNSVDDEDADCEECDCECSCDDESVGDSKQESIVFYWQTTPVNRQSVDKIASLWAAIESVHQYNASLSIFLITNLPANQIEPKLVDVITLLPFTLSSPNSNEHLSSTLVLAESVIYGWENDLLTTNVLVLDAASIVIRSEFEDFNLKNVFDSLLVWY